MKTTHTIPDMYRAFKAHNGWASDEDIAKHAEEAGAKFMPHMDGRLVLAYDNIWFFGFVIGQTSDGKFVVLGGTSGQPLLFDNVKFIALNDCPRAVGWNSTESEYPGDEPQCGRVIGYRHGKWMLAIDGTIGWYDNIAWFDPLTRRNDADYYDYQIKFITKDVDDYL